MHRVQELLQAFVHLQNHTDCLVPAQIPKCIARCVTRRTESIDDTSAIRGFLKDHIPRHPHCDRYTVWEVRVQQRKKMGWLEHDRDRLTKFLSR